MNSIFIYDELGRKRARLRRQSYKVYTLPDNLNTALTHEFNSRSKNSSTNTLIFLGISANLEEMLDMANSPKYIYKHVYYLECPEILAHASLPAPWQKLSPETFLAQLPNFLSTATILEHKQNSQLFSQFWLKILAELELASLTHLKQPRPECSLPQSMLPLPKKQLLQTQVPQIIIPGTKHDLLTQELLLACAELQLSALLMDTLHLDSAALYPYICGKNLPQLYLSVNLRGLDAEGKNFSLLRAAKVPVAIWFVDNPWHNLSNLTQPWWQEALIFVSDASFVEPLKAHGAKKVYFLPLGAWMNPNQTGHGQAQLNFLAQASAGLNLAPITFVGRSSFPDRNKFFAGLKLNATPKDQLVPSVHYWQEFYNINKCWPGKTYRQAGFAAEHCSLLKRLTWLKAALDYGLTVFGDAAWKTLLPSLTDLRQPLDYYSKLGHIYQQAEFTLNITSYLLPSGLTQRHFDVFASGGFLLTDHTKGLDIFPKQLTSPISMVNPQDLGKHIRHFQNNPNLKQDLIFAWQEELKARHSYKIRLETILSIL